MKTFSLQEEEEILHRKFLLLLYPYRRTSPGEPLEFSSINEVNPFHGNGKSAGRIKRFPMQIPDTLDGKLAGEITSETVSSIEARLRDHKPGSNKVAGKDFQFLKLEAATANFRLASFPESRLCQSRRPLPASCPEGLEKTKEGRNSQKNLGRKHVRGSPVRSHWIIFRQGGS